MTPFREIRCSRLLLVLALAMMTLGIATPLYGQSVINCPSGFNSATSGACSVSFGYMTGTQSFLAPGSGGDVSSLSGTSLTLIPAGTTHNGYCFNYQTQVNVQAFTSTFTFVPDGYNVAFVLNNSNNNPSFNGSSFCSGAGAEAGFYQEFSQSTPPNNIFALEFDSNSPLTTPPGTFSYSSVQIYQSGQNPSSNPPNKISTSPVPLDSPATTGDTSTGDVYSATITYDGSNVTVNLYDVTAGGACPGTACFTYTWNNVNIPSWVGSNTAWVGITAGQNLTVTTPLSIDSMTYSVGSAGQKPGTPQALQGDTVLR